MSKAHHVIAAGVLKKEAAGIQQLARELERTFDAFVDAILQVTGAHGDGKVVVSGLGKSGLIGMKIAATLTSTGTPAIFMHPVEALHGDIGIVGKNDVCLALSKSGGTEELLRFLVHFRRLGGPIGAITARKEGNRLAEVADYTIYLPNVEEPSRLSVVPMASTTMTLALGDAIAAACFEARGFKDSDFARYHPEGALGRRLLYRVEDLMFKGDEVPMVKVSCTFLEMIHEMSLKGLGLVCVVEKDGTLFGVITDGDLRRIIERHEGPLNLSIPEAWQISARVQGTRSKPLTVNGEMMAVTCWELMRRNKITSLVVVDYTGKPIGVIRAQELNQAGMS